MELIDPLDRSHSQKLYQQLLGIFKEKMSQGEWRVGTQIPTEEQLCAHYRVSRATVRLGIPEAHPVLRVRQIAYAAGDLPAGVSESLYRTDRYSRTVSLERLKI